MLVLPLCVLMQGKRPLLLCHVPVVYVPRLDIHTSESTDNQWKHMPDVVTFNSHNKCRLTDTSMVDVQIVACH